VKSTHRHQGFRMASMSMIKKEGLLLDHKYYIDRQIKLPVLQLYEALGWKFF
jgi:DNA polymerase elongation subunit (family B)